MSLALADSELDALWRDLQRVPVGAIATELITRRFVLVNDAAARLFGVPAGDLVGTDVVVHIDPSEQEAASKAYAALAQNLIDGYQATRTLARPDGSKLVVSVWGRRIDSEQGLFGLWVVIRENDDVGLERRPGAAAEICLAITDHDWQIAYASSDSRLVRADGQDLVGTPLLGLVHPSAAADFLTGTVRAVSSHMAVTMATRLRVGQNEWMDRFCVVVPMCRHDPPRLGIVVTPRPTLRSVTPIDASASIHPHLERAALEARAAGVLRALPVVAAHPGAPRLSPRQLEVLSRLIAGEDVQEIAEALYLSRSTVRNHLTVIYRKFAVHSRAELLALLLRSASSEAS